MSCMSFVGIGWPSAAVGRYLQRAGVYAVVCGPQTWPRWVGMGQKEKKNGKDMM